MNYTEKLFGKTIRFTAKVDDHEIMFDEGMKGRVCDARLDHDTVRIIVDFSDYEEVNKKFGKANFYDKNGEPTKYWWEMGHPMYPTNKREVVYLEVDEKLWPFEILEEEQDLSGEIAKKTVELFGTWLDRWSFFSVKGQRPSDVYGAWDRVRAEAKRIVEESNSKQ